MSTNAVSTKQPRMPKPSQVKISKLWSQCFHLFGLVTKFETFHWIRNSTLCPNPFIFLLRLSFMESLGFLKDFLHVSFHSGSWTGRTSCLFGDWSTSVSLEQVAPPPGHSGATFIPPGSLSCRSHCFDCHATAGEISYKLHIIHTKVDHHLSNPPPEELLFLLSTS